MQLTEKVKRFVTEYNMIEEGDTVIIGLSGGADSVCLCLVLWELQKVVPFALHAIHVNHQIRKAGAEQDQQFVEALCRTWNIPLEVQSVNVPTLAKERGMSEEEMGRHIRYALFEQKRTQVPNGKIAVAHHKNDQAETILYHLCRGSGLRGMGGIRPVRDRVIRPLLCVTKEEILHFLKEREQSYCIDETNFDNQYTRNRIRNEILPLLSRYINEKSIVHLAETAARVQEVSQFIDGMGQQLYERAVKKKSETEYVLDLDICMQEDLVLQQWVVGKILEVLSQTHKNIENVHIMSTIGLKEKQTGRQISLPYGMIVRKEYHTLSFRKGSKQETLHTEETICRLETTEEPAVLETAHLTICTQLIRAETCGTETGGFLAEIPKNNCTKWFDYDKIKGTVILRKMEQTDALQIDREGHHKLAGKICKDARISAEGRKKMYVLADEAQPLWIPFVRSNEYYRITEETKYILQITLIPKDTEDTTAEREEKHAD